MNGIRAVVSFLVASFLPLISILADDAQIRVMSFNIRYGTAGDGENHWEKRKELVLKTIRKFDPDLLGTQETLGFQAEFLKEHLKEARTYVGWSRDRNEGGEQCGILIRTQRFQLMDSGQFWLSETPKKKFSRSWDSSLPRVATWVKLMDRTTDAPLLFLNTHFDHRGATARLRSAEIIRRFVESQPAGLPIVVTGDFNCGEDSDPYKHLVASARIADSHREKYPDRKPLEGTFNGFRGTADGARIDWILCSPAYAVSSCAIVRTEQHGKYPSDHFPVTASLK